MSGYAEKGRISKILPQPVDWYGHPTKATVNPCTNAGAVTPAITIDWRLRGKNGQLKVGDEVAYCLFDDGTGIIFARLDGENSGVVDYNVETTGVILNDQTMTTKGDVFNQSNVTTDLVTTSKGKIVGQGGMSITGSGSGDAAVVTGSIKATGDIVAGDISLQNHVHTEQGDGADVSKPK